MSAEEKVGCSETGVTDDSELPCGCWELNLGLLEEQPVRLSTESSLQAPEIELVKRQCPVLQEVWLMAWEIMFNNILMTDKRTSYLVLLKISNL